MQITDSYEDAEVTISTAHDFALKRGTTFIAVASGCVMINDHWPIFAGMYACFTHGYALSTPHTRAMFVRAKHFKGIFSMGGPIEPTGRLRYIDGCSDTGLIAPLRLGDPCLNFLHFPPGIKQTEHTHPSLRAGLVLKGAGACGDILMQAGDIFVIPAHCVHAFETDYSPMDIIAFHPDSVFGPTDDHHQMLDATLCTPK